MSDVLQDRHYALRQLHKSWEWPAASLKSYRDSSRASHASHTLRGQCQLANALYSTADGGRYTSNPSVTKPMEVSAS